MTDETETPALLKGIERMTLQDLKEKKPTALLEFAEALEIENASTMRKQSMLFAVLKTLAERDVEIHGGGVLEVLQDGFGFLRSPESNYLAGPDDIYVSPTQIRKFGLRTGDTVEVKFAARGTENGILPFSRSIRSISKHLKQRATKCTSII